MILNYILISPKFLLKLLIYLKDFLNCSPCGGAEFFHCHGF
jgi:hypothetical protein